MADFLNIILPSGWVSMGGNPRFDITKLGRPGRYQIQENGDYAVWNLTASYLRSEYESVEEHSFDGLYNFFLVSGARFCFLVIDELDGHSTDLGGTGIVKSVGGVYRLFKRYTSFGQAYDHPITRPRGAITLGGGAAGGSVSASTGIVSGIASAGTWTGAFYRPMIFVEGGLSYKFSPDGTLEAFDVPLEEQLEI